MDARVAFAALTAVSMSARNWRSRRRVEGAGGRPGAVAGTPARRRAAGRSPRSVRSVSRTTESRMPATRSAFSMSSGKTLKPLGSTMMSRFRPCRTRRPRRRAGPGRPSGTSRRGEGGRRRGRVVPVAPGDAGAAEEDLAILGDAHLDAGDRAADRAERMVAPRRAAPEPVSVAPYPCITTTPMSSHPCCGGGQERTGRHEEPEVPPSCAGPGGRSSAARPSAGGGRSAGSARTRPPGPVGRPRAGSRPEHVEDLRHQDHRRGPMVTDRLEHDPRVPAPDVEDVRAEVEDR